MEIQHIITFLKVAELKNFTKTAQELNFSQSTISFHIKTLEKDLGIKLFHRDSRKLSLTFEGKMVLPSCKKLRDDYYNLLDVTKRSGEEHTPIRLATVGSFLIYRLSDIIQNFKEQYPTIDFQLSNSRSNAFAELIKTNMADLAFFVTPDLVDDSINLIHLGREPMYLIYPNSYTFKDYKGLALDLTACYSETGCSYKEIFMQFHTNHLIKPQSSLESWSVEMIKKSVMSGIGYSILPRMCIADEMNSGQFQFEKLDFNKYYIDLNFGYRKDRELPPHLKHFTELVKESLR